MAAADLYATNTRNTQFKAAGPSIMIAVAILMLSARVNTLTPSVSVAFDLGAPLIAYASLAMLLAYAFSVGGLSEQHARSQDTRRSRDGKETHEFLLWVRSTKRRKAIGSKRNVDGERERLNARQREMDNLLQVRIRVIDRGPRARARIGNRVLVPELIAMFFFFSNGLGIAGSMLVSVLLSLLLLYACSHG